MFEYDEKAWELAGHHFVGNVITATEKKSNLVLLEEDPRKARLKPDAFPVRVEQVGPKCRFVLPGDLVVIERWMWKQFNIDNERLIANEADLLILDNSVPAPGVIVIDLIEDVKKTPLIVPSSVKPKAAGYIHGRILNSAHPDFEVGWEIWVEKLEHNQFRFQNKLAFRVNEEMASVLAVQKPEPAEKSVTLEVV